MNQLRLMCVLAHPDDESLGTGGTLATYASENRYLREGGQVFRWPADWYAVSSQRVAPRQQTVV